MKTHISHILTKSTDLKYFYEFAAIPKSTRFVYLNQLLERKNAVSQKNVRLLKLIYSYIEKNRLTEWDSRKVCLLLNVSKDMLYCHKSRLLKGLRSFYFNFKIKPENFYTIESKFEKVKKMDYLGMYREAKIIFLKLEQEIHGKKRKTVEDKYRLLLITRTLYLYYHHTENKKQHYYLKQSLKLCNELLRLYKSSNDQNIFNNITIIKHYLLAFKTDQNKKKLKNKHETIKYFKLAFESAKRNKDYTRQCEILRNIALHNFHLRNFAESEKNISKAFGIARKNKLKTEELILESTEINYNSITKKQSEEVLKKRFTELLKKLPYYDITPVHKIYIYSNLLPVASIYPGKTLYNFVYNMNSLSIIIYGYRYSFRMLYWTKLSYYSDKLFDLKNSEYKKQEIPFAERTNAEYSEKLWGCLNELNINHRCISDLYFQKEVFLYSLVLELSKGLKYNPENAEYIIRRIESLNKSRGEVVIEYMDRLFEVLKLITKMIEDQQVLNHKHFLDKHLMEFENSCKRLLDDSDNFILLYNLHSFVATLSGYEELQDIIKKLYPQIYKKRKEYFDDIINSTDREENEINEYGLLYTAVA